MGILSLSFILINVFCVVYTFSTLFNFVFFVSGEKSGFLAPQNVAQNQGAVWRSIVWDAFLVISFVFSHSLMANNRTKTLVNCLAPIHRSVFIALSSFFMQIVIDHWVSVSPNQMPLLWSNSNETLIMLCQLFQTLAWFLIFSTIYILDVAEFLGIKQVFYEYYNLGPPLSFKTQQAQDFYSNMRHPNFVGPLVVFWAVPCMSIDRFLLALVFTIYPLLTSKLTDTNYEYVKKMYLQKRIDIKRFSHSG